MSAYITTPIFYASGNPHLGHIYSGFIADTLKRYFKLKGINTFLITGTDENGQKIERTAKSAGIEVSQFVESKSLLFRALWQELGIKPDNFVRTTNDKHHILVAEIWNKLLLNDSIYLGTYNGLYCVDCEQYYSEWQITKGCCPIHRKPLDEVSEPSYLFRLDKYRLRLLDFYTSHPKFIQPYYFQEEIIKQLQQPKIDDLSVSRTNVKWGIQVPGDNKHVIYVWLDALFSYLTALKDLEESDQTIKDTIHVIGKDILQFHAIYWPAFLLAVDLPLPKNIIVHGWWTIEGEKISKSNPRSLIKPTDLIKITSIDGLRYGLLRQKPLDRDGDLSINELVTTINSDLANSLGNLVKRFITLVNKYFDGSLDWKETNSLDENSNQLITETNNAIPSIAQSYTDRNFQKGCTTINDIIAKTNTYFHTREPWNLGKGVALCNVVETLSVVNAVLNVIYAVYSPIIPDITRKIRYQLRQEDQSLSWPKACLLRSVHVRQPETIFKRINFDEY